MVEEFHRVFESEAFLSGVRPECISKYRDLEVLGRGAFGTVFKAYNRETNEIVALKRIAMIDKTEGVPSSIIREISFLKQMEHPHIVRLLDVVITEEEGRRTVYLVFEYMDCDLKNFMVSKPEVARQPDVIKSFLRQILRGVAYCHSHKIIHRDLKPENLLIENSEVSEPILKLADFGSAREVCVPLKTYTGGDQIATRIYQAPELINGFIYSTEVDMWSVGCIFGEMCNLTPLFPAKELLDLPKLIFSLLGIPDEESWPEVTLFCKTFGIENNPKNLLEKFPDLGEAGVNLLSKMLCYKPSERITAWDALQHSYFDGYDGN